MVGGEAKAVLVHNSFVSVFFYISRRFGHFPMKVSNLKETKLNSWFSFRCIRHDHGTIMTAEGKSPSPLFLRALCKIRFYKFFKIRITEL